MHIKKEYASILRDDHRHLKDAKLWDYIRKNYKEPIK
jgi:hypothetical protein